MGHYKTSVHLNGHLLCAVDVETTGLDPRKHDIYEICVAPLEPDYTPSKSFSPFHTFLQPARPENIDEKDRFTPRNKILHAQTYGLDPWVAIERFTEWFKDLNLAERKMIVPLGANYQFDQTFITAWLGGPESYSEFFRSDYRDVQQAALLLNDMADWHQEQIPFPKVNLTYLCSCLKVENPAAHTAIGDAYSSAEVYRKMMRYRDMVRI